MNDGSVGVSPAFNVNLSSVIFSYVISGESTATSGKEYKLTLKDANTKITPGTITKSGNTVTVPYTVEDTKNDDGITAEKVTVVIERTTTAEEVVTKTTTLYVEQAIAAFSNGTATGSIEFTLPNDFDAATDKVYITAQDLNGEKETDYASALEEIAVPTTSKITADDGIIITQNNGSLTGDALNNVTGNVTFTADKLFTVNNTPATLDTSTNKYTLTHTMSGDATAQFVAVEVDNSSVKSYYKTLSAAVTNAETGATITLMDDVTETAVIKAENKSITIKGETGKTHTVTSSVTDLINAGEGGSITLGNGLKIEESSSILYAHNGGQIIVDGAELHSNNNQYVATYAEHSGSKITVKSGSISQTGANVVTMSIADSATAEITGGVVTNDASTTIAAKSGGTITVKGGTVSTTANMVAGYAVSNGKIVVENGNVSSGNFIDLSAIYFGQSSGGTIEVKGGNIAHAVGAYEGNTSKVIISGGTIGSEVTGNAWGVCVYSGATAEITGGKIRGYAQVPSGYTGTLTVSGGVFENALNSTATIENGKKVFKLVENADGYMYGVGNTPTFNVTAKVGNDNYDATNGITYDGTKTVTLSANPSVDHIDAFNDAVSDADDYAVKYYYLWYKKMADGSSFDEITDAIAETYTVGPNAETGNTYRYNAKLSANEENGTNSSEIAVTINKAAPTANAPTGLTATYGQTLADVIMTNPTGNTAGSWAWVDDTTSVGDYGVRTFAANFTPTDATNYNNATNVQVTVTVGKAVPTYEAPVLQGTRLTHYSSDLLLIKTAGSVTYGQGTMSYALTEVDEAPAADAVDTWKTNISDIKATKANTYYVWYKITGADNYELAPTKLGSVRVNQYTAPSYSSQTWTLTMDSYEYDGTAHTPTINGKAYTYSNTQVQYTYYNADTNEELDGAPSAIGNYKVKVYADGGSSYYSRTQEATYSILTPTVDENGKADVAAFKDNDMVPEAEGKIFAGWFTDETCTTPYTDNSGEAYAKFIDEKILTVKAQISSGTTVNSASTSIRFITSVDSLKYQNVGFKITFNGKTIDQKMTKVYTAINANGAKVKPTVFSADSHYMEAYTLNNIPKDAFGKTFTVTPYYTTQDGTIVDGATNTFTIANMIK